PARPNSPSKCSLSTRFLEHPRLMMRTLREGVDGVGVLEWAFMVVYFEKGGVPRMRGAGRSRHRWMSGQNRRRIRTQRKVAVRRKGCSFANRNRSWGLQALSRELLQLLYGVAPGLRGPGVKGKSPKW